MYRQFEVEKILGHCRDPKGCYSYWLKWKGYDNSYSSFEPYEHVYDKCGELLDQYHSKVFNKHKVLNKRKHSTFIDITVD